MAKALLVCLELIIYRTILGAFVGAFWMNLLLEHGLGPVHFAVTVLVVMPWIALLIALKSTPNVMKALKALSVQRSLRDGSARLIMRSLARDLLLYCVFAASAHLWSGQVKSLVSMHYKASENSLFFSYGCIVVAVAQTYGFMKLFGWMTKAWEDGSPEERGSRIDRSIIDTPPQA